MSRIGSRLRGILVIMLAYLMVGCGGDDKEPPPNNNSVVFDCTETNISCPQIEFEGDNFQNTVFSGFADPSIRKDPNTDRIWMTYSWPRLFGLSSGTTLVETHFAYSDDAGGSWTYDQPLYESSSITNLFSGQLNYISNEITSTWPVDNGDGTTTWYAARLQYPVIPGSYIYDQLGAQSYIKVARANSIVGLKTAEEAVLAPAGLLGAYPFDTKLSSLHADVSSCITWMEEALIHHDGRLYLAVQCWALDGLELDHDQFFYAVFSTNASGSTRDWIWRYEGKFLLPEEAQLEFGHTFFNQLDFSKRSDGTILLIATLADPLPTENRDHYHGCVVMEAESLSPPGVVKDGTGRFKVLSKVTASDLDTYGPAACAYEPESTTGVLITRRVFEDPVVGAQWKIHGTGIHPQ